MYPISTVYPELEYGDKSKINQFIYCNTIVLLPDDAILIISIVSNWKFFFLNYVDGTRAQYPLMFKLSFGKNATFCGVKEFSAARGMCYIPRWVILLFSVFCLSHRLWKSWVYFLEILLPFAISRLRRLHLSNSDFAMVVLVIWAILEPCIFVYSHLS